MRLDLYVFNCNSLVISGVPSHFLNLADSMRLIHSIESAFGSARRLSSTPCSPAKLYRVRVQQLVIFRFKRNFQATNVLEDIHVLDLPEPDNLSPQALEQIQAKEEYCSCSHFLKMLTFHHQQMLINHHIVM
jgi:hypothetical protein